MSHSKMTRRSLLLGIPAVACGFSQLASGQEPRGNFNEPVFRVSNKSENRTDTRAVAGEHPLAPALRIAEDGLVRIENDIHDYQCTLVKRERIGGKLLDHEFMDAKIRHNPFSVYLAFKNPASVRGREVLYVEGQNNNNIMAHEGGALLKLVTVNLNPTSSLAMRNNRYPITEIGVKNLVQRLIEVAKEDMQYGECEVKFTPNAKINGRVCTLIEVVHPVPRSNFRFHKAHIFIDDQLQVPVRFASWDWPAQNGGEAPLLEEYTYLDMKINNGFTDADFDSNHPNYKF